MENKPQAMVLVKKTSIEIASHRADIQASMKAERAEGYLRRHTLSTTKYITAFQHWRIASKLISTRSNRLHQGKIMYTYIFSPPFSFGYVMYLLTFREHVHGCSRIMLQYIRTLEHIMQKL